MLKIIEELLLVSIPRIVTGIDVEEPVSVASHLVLRKRHGLRFSPTLMLPKDQRTAAASNRKRRRCPALHLVRRRA